MGSTRRSFTEEYKDQAVAFVIEGNRSVADVARNIGVHEMTLGKWVKKTRDSQQELIPPDAELTGSERLELIRLRAGLKDDKATIAEYRTSDPRCTFSTGVAVPLSPSPKSCGPGGVHILGVPQRIPERHTSADGSVVGRPLSWAGAEHFVQSGVKVAPAHLLLRSEVACRRPTGGRDRRHPILRTETSCSACGLIAQPICYPSLRRSRPPNLSGGW